MGVKLIPASDILVALRVARGYIVVALEEFREEQTELDAADPPRPERTRVEDAETVKEIESHLALIDAAIAKASPV